MTSKTNIGLVEWAYRMLGQPYWYGTCGYPATLSLLKRKTEQYPAHYTAAREKRHKEDIAKGAIVSDCVGLIKGYYWMRDDGTQVYGLDGRPDKGANGMFEAAKAKGPIATLPEIPGLLLYYEGHIGVYIGGGQAIEAQSHNTGVALTQVKARKWTHWCACRYIDYVNGEIPLPEAPLVPEAPEAKPTPAPEAPVTPAARILYYKEGQTMMRGDDVRWVQETLAILGFDPGKVDGIFGSDTNRALRAFQAGRLVTDGIVGEKTRALLLSERQAAETAATEQDNDTENHDVDTENHDNDEKKHSEDGEPSTDGGEITAPEAPEAPELPHDVDEACDDEDAPPPDYGTRLLKYVKGRKLMSGDDVRAVQERLLELGLDPGKVDGLYGAKCEAAVMEFQTNAGINADGMVGPVTRLALRKK